MTFTWKRIYLDTVGKKMRKVRHLREASVLRWKSKKPRIGSFSTQLLLISITTQSYQYVQSYQSHAIQSKLQNDPDLRISRIEPIPDHQFLVLHLNKIVQPQSGVYIFFEFSGKLLWGPYGLYLTKSPNPGEGQPERLNAVSKFETTSARFMIPCFDEPEFKATWRVQLTHPTGTTALSNTMEESSVPISDEWVVTNYKKTVIMSSYLLAVFIGDVDFKEDYTKSGVRVSFQGLQPHNNHVCRLEFMPLQLTLTGDSSFIGLFVRSPWFSIQFPLQRSLPFWEQLFRNRYGNSWTCSSVVRKPSDYGLLEQRLAERSICIVHGGSRS